MKKGIQIHRRILFLGIVMAGFISLGIRTSAFEKITDGDFWLKAENQGEDNYIFLEWEDVDPDRFYTIYQSDDEMASWQTRSAAYGKVIRVLNVYPVAGGDGLKAWMEDNGYGKDPDGGEQLIFVDKVLLSAYNADPELYLKDSSGNYQYDVVVFGFWDWNGGSGTAYDLTELAKNATDIYMQNGYGVLFGHDTAVNNGNHSNFVYLAEKYTNIDAKTSTEVKLVGGTKIKSINDGFLLQYPWQITYQEELTVPHSHSFSQIAGGIIWMEYVEPFASNHPGPVTTTPSGGSSNFYLTTWYNTAMIQTGHTSGTSSDSEQKVLANVLMYLAQYTDETTAEDRSASDKAAPKVPAVTWGSTVEELTISAEDLGTPYWYKIEATSKHDMSDVKVSDEVLEYCTTGIKGYYIIEDQNDYTNFDEAGAAFYPAEADQTYDYTMTDIRNYLHIKAVDHAGNISKAVRISPYDYAREMTVIKNLDKAADQAEHFVYRIDYKLEEAGAVLNTYYGVISVPAGDTAAACTFQNLLPGIYLVTEEETNWKYELDGSCLKSQKITMKKPEVISETAVYQNNEQEKSWIYGEGIVINQLK